MQYPVLPTDILTINSRLREEYGIDTESALPMWRVSWAADQFEMRVDDVTPSGVRLLFPEMMRMPKYSWIKDEWVLENLVLVPIVNLSEIPESKKSYECIWRFHDRFKKPVEPKYWACQFIIDIIASVKTGNPMNVKKYSDPQVGKSPLEQAELDKVRIDGLIEQLFGDESALMMRTVTGEAVAMPTNYKREGES